MNVSTIGNKLENAFEVARLTPVGRGAVACIGVRGSVARERLMARWRREDGGDASIDLPTRPYFGLFRFDELNGVCEELVVRVRTPNAFELDCHGGTIVSSRLLDYFVSCGATVVSDDKWICAVEREERILHSSAPLPSFRFDLLFYSGSETLISRTTTEKTAVVACQQREAWHAWFKKTLDLIASRDRAVLREIDRILLTNDWGRFLVSPISIALIGVPNAGKSSLLNASMGYERAIVSAVSGTTRDLVSGRFVFDGWNFQMTDAAGLRETADPLERAGTVLAQENARRADVSVRLFDPTRSRSEQENTFVQFFSEFDGTSGAFFLDVLNKVDLPVASWDDEWKNAEKTPISISARSGEGVEKFLSAISEPLNKLLRARNESDPIVVTKEQKEYLIDLRNRLERDDWEGTFEFLKEETAL